MGMITHKYGKAPPDPVRDHMFIEINYMGTYDPEGVEFNPTP